VTTFRVERDEASAPFFDAAARGTLLIKHCPRCGTSHPPQARHCADGSELEWAPASGGAVLVTWAVDHSPPLDPSLASPDGTGSTFGWVELDEGPWLQAPIVDFDPALLAEGLPLRVRFIQPGGGEVLPAFTPA
jgi:uncharacterized protein